MLPEKFSEKMKNLLGADYPAFEKAILGDAVRGLRVNTLKCKTDEFLSENSLPLSPVSYTENGFILNSDEQVGRLAEHHSGRIYMQDPGAMAPLSAIEIPRGKRVVDLCAAPGGKSGQAAAMIGEEGFLLSNEFVAKRAKILVSNFERLGIKNAVVTSMDTAALAENYTEYFDYAIVDAPCSGEGMFRKNDAAIDEWSEENVKISSLRQAEIIRNAAKMIREGGYIIYSTCTYSPEENEEIIDSFLNEYPAFSPVELNDRIKGATSPSVATQTHLSGARFARRFYPHISNGEGQFLAILRKNSSFLPTKICKDNTKPLSKDEAKAVSDFIKSTFIKVPDARIVKVGDNPVLLPESIPSLPARSVFMAGVLIGEIQKGRLTPSHQLFSAYGNLFKSKVELSGDERSLNAYLEGEEIPAPDGLENGYCVITYKGSPLGGGKISSGRIKNHYPKGLRNRRL